LIDESSSDTVEIVQSPAPVINFRGHADTIYKDGFTTLNPNLPIDLNYLWTPNSYTYPFYLVEGRNFAPGAHTFVLKVTDSLLCVDQKTVSVYILDEVGVEGKSVASFSIYPNPVQDQLTISSTGLNGNYQLHIMDINGRIVKAQLINATEMGRNELSLSALKSGTYVLRIFNDGQSLVHKFVKE
jgi:hypothetical protein